MYLHSSVVIKSIYVVKMISLQIMDMEGWVLLGADRQEVPVTVYPGQDLVEADLSDVPDVYQDLHWHAPKTYLGDKVRTVDSGL